MDKKIMLSEKEIPERWYNIVHDMPNKPLPPLHPGTKQPIGPEMLEPLFPMELIMQEVSGEKWIAIPEEVRDIYRMWRPTPVISEALKAREEGKSKTILFNLCGHGNFDMSAYDDYLSGKMIDHEVTKKEIEESLAEIEALQA